MGSTGSDIRHRGTKVVKASIGLGRLGRRGHKGIYGERE
jgi:hypothetical protein